MAEECWGEPKARLSCRRNMLESYRGTESCGCYMLKKGSLANFVGLASYLWKKMQCTHQMLSWHREDVIFRRMPVTRSCRQQPLQMAELEQSLLLKLNKVIFSSMHLHLCLANVIWPSQSIWFSEFGSDHSWQKTQEQGMGTQRRRG